MYSSSDVARKREQRRVLVAGVGVYVHGVDERDRISATPSLSINACSIANNAPGCSQDFDEEDALPALPARL